MRRDSDRDHPCGDCITRREFLDDSVAFVAAVAAALGAVPQAVRAWSSAEASTVTISGDEHAYPLPSADAVTIDRTAQIILVRYQGTAFAFNLACPHENTALKWRQHDGRFQCPQHDSKYRPDGTFLEGRATRNMDRFAVRRDGANLIVDVSCLFRSDENKAEWASAIVRVE